MKRMLTILWIVGLAGVGSAAAEQAPISDDTQACLECHATLHPGIVEGWKLSRHARITPAKAMEVTGLARKVSRCSPTIP